MRSYSDMALLRQCTLSNDPAIKTACGDYWGGDIGAGQNTTRTNTRNSFMYSRCTNDTPTLRAQFRFNVIPLATVATDNDSGQQNMPTAMLLSKEFSPVVYAPAYVSAVTTNPRLTYQFDTTYNITDICLIVDTTSTTTNTLPSYFQLTLITPDGPIMQSGSALDIVSSADPMQNGQYWWTFVNPTLASGVQLQCFGNQAMSIRYLAAYAIDLNQNATNCACFMNTADAAKIGYLPFCNSPACKQVNIMSTMDRAAMNGKIACNQTIFNCSQIIDVSAASQNTIMQNVTLSQQCGPLASGAHTLAPPAAVVAGDTDASGDDGSGTTYGVVFVLLCMLIIGIIYVSCRSGGAKTKPPPVESADARDSAAKQEDDASNNVGLGTAKQEDDASNNVGLGADTMRNDASNNVGLGAAKQDDIASSNVGISAAKQEGAASNNVGLGEDTMRNDAANNVVSNMQYDNPANSFSPSMQYDMPQYAQQESFLGTPSTQYAPPETMYYDMQNMQNMQNMQHVQNMQNMS